MGAWGAPTPGRWVVAMLTLAKLRKGSVQYYNDTARAATSAGMDAAKANGGLGEYYSEHDTREPVWIVAGDAEKVGALCGLGAAELAGGRADKDAVARWLDAGIAPNGAHGRKFSARSNHGFDLTFCAPKSASMLRALDIEGVLSKAVVEAHNAAVREAMAYLHRHAGYTRVYNAATGMNDLQRLPGLVAAAYQHETSRAGDPHLHSHVLVSNRQPRADGMLVSLDSDSLFHELKAAGIIYQATYRSELRVSTGLEHDAPDANGMAELAGVDHALLAAGSQRSTQIRAWADEHLVVSDTDELTPAQLATAQKATRPRKPEHLGWHQLKEEWAEKFGARLFLDGQAQAQARTARRAAITEAVSDTQWAARAAGASTKAAFTRADLIETLGAGLPDGVGFVKPDGSHSTPREMLEVLADRVAIAITEPRQAHEREGHTRYTTAAILNEERAMWDLASARSDAAVIPSAAVDAALADTQLSRDQAHVVRQIAQSPWLLQTLSAPAGAGKTTTLKALREAAHRGGIRRVVVLAPTGKAYDVARAEGAGDAGGTVAAAIKALDHQRFTLDHRTLVVIDEAGMVGTPELRRLSAAAKEAGAKTVLVGDAEQLDPVQRRGGMFGQLADDLPWAQRLSEVWRMADPNERRASLAIHDGDPDRMGRAVDWYRRHGRLHTGDAVTMADDALAAWNADQDAGIDALLIADKWDVVDALNERVHRQRISEDADTVLGARGHRIAEGDTIITRHNDPDVTVWSDAGRTTRITDTAQVRNGQRWEVLAVDPDRKRLAARRLSDGAVAVLDGDYLRRHTHYGYAVTVHAVQGATTGRCYGLLSADRAARSKLYVALTRGKESNHVFLYDSVGGEGDHEHTPTVAAGIHVARRGDGQAAADALRRVLARDDAPLTAAAVAEATPRDQLQAAVSELVDHRGKALHAMRLAHDPQGRTDYVRRLRDRIDVELAVLSAADRSRLPRTGLTLDPAATAALPEQARRGLAALAASPATITPVRTADEATTDAAMRALRDAQHRAGGTLLWWSPDQVAAERATAAGVADHITTIAASKPLPEGAVLVVEDAASMAPEGLRFLVEHAADRGARVILLDHGDTDTGQTKPSAGVLRLLHTDLPWAVTLTDEEPAADWRTAPVLDQAQDWDRDLMPQPFADALARRDQLRREHQATQVSRAALQRLSAARRREQARGRGRDDYGIGL